MRPLLALVALAWIGCSNNEPTPAPPAADTGVTLLDRGPGPDLVAPDRAGFEHELFVVTSGGSGRAFRIRMGTDRLPLVAAANHTTFYDGRALACFGRLAVRHTEELGQGYTYHQTRVRLWEEDGLGTGRWVHNHGLLTPLTGDPATACEPDEVCRWEDRSGMDLVSVVGDLRGMRVWSGGYRGGDHGTASVRYVIHDRFGDPQDLLDLYGGDHRELVRAARAVWDALPEETRGCHQFDYKSSYLRPSPGGLMWVMHGTAAFESCHGTTVAVEVPAPPPRHGNVVVEDLGASGEEFQFGPPDVRIDDGTTVTGDGWTLRLPGGTAEDPPLAAVHWMASADIRPGHREPLDAAFTAVLPVPSLPGRAPVIDGRLDDWAGDEMLLLDRLDNVAWQREDGAWSGAGDASMGVGLRAAADGWVVAARALDDVRVAGAGPRADQFQLWVRGPDGWVRLAVVPSEEPGVAVVTPVSLARSGELDEDLPTAAAARFDGARAAWTVLQDDDEVYRGMDLEVWLPSDAFRLNDGELGLRVLFADGDGGDELRGDSLVGNAASRVDVWTRVEESG